jgi:uncharacterized protein YjiS (DUF1127 family)
MEGKPMALPAPVLTWLTTAWHGYFERSRAKAQRRLLLSLPDECLRDIGLTRAQVLAGDLPRPPARGDDILIIPILRLRRLPEDRA